MSRAGGQYGMLYGHGFACESGVSYVDRNRGNGAVRGELQISTCYALPDRRRNPPLRLEVGGEDKMDRSSPRGGLVHALYLLMGSKLAQPVAGCDSRLLQRMSSRKNKVV